MTNCVALICLLVPFVIVNGDLIGGSFNETLADVSSRESLLPYPIAQVTLVKTKSPAMERLTYRMDFLVSESPLVVKR
jgi:hypothetical protein